MHTLLSKFCEEFVQIVRPLLAPLNRVEEAFGKATGSRRDPALVAQLVDLRQQFALLADKVEDQQAYVLIFGPLKSGKSTLMNAIAGSYVSEVSSLPAYPCMVFVSHAAKPEFMLTRYDGEVETFEGPAPLKGHVDLAHRQLATRIREAEAAGEDFDPRSDYTRAIHKIHVKVPTEGLGHSNAVMVDTPGLYSRMKFGYDRMTRDFRNAAACAVFVVRSDNLFSDRVFTEFNDLLELFSRIFLVVNVDSRKVDLDPEGNLVPSLEQSDPQRIIDAFEVLAMTAPLKRAAEDGRLRIYAVDLLEAGRERLQRARSKSGEPADPAPNAGPPASGADSGFDSFLGDLTSYLDSTDHLVAFLGDSMRRGSTLLSEVDEFCRSERVEQLGGWRADLQSDIGRFQERLDALFQLQGVDWSSQFDTLREQLETACGQIATDIAARTERDMDQSVRDWFRSKDSLNTLAKDRLVPMFTRYQESLIEALSRELSDRLVRDEVGVDLPKELTLGLREVDIDLPAIGREAHQLTDRRALVRVPPTPLRAEHFRIRRSLWDSVMMRRQATLQQRLFGSGDRPDRAVSADQKRARLGEEGRERVQASLGEYRKRFFADTVGRVVAGFTKGYVDLVVDRLGALLAEQRFDFDKKMAKVKADQTECDRLLKPVSQLKSDATLAREAVDRLSKHYGDVDLFLLTQPIKVENPIPTPAPAERPGARAPSGSATRPEQQEPAEAEGAPEKTAERAPEKAPEKSAPIPQGSSSKAEKPVPMKPMPAKLMPAKPPQPLPAKSPRTKAAPKKTMPARFIPSQPESKPSSNDSKLSQ